MIIRSAYDQFREAAKRFPRNECVRFENVTYSYKKVEKGIEEAARKLTALGIQPGEVVAVALPNCPESVFLFYAINYIGATSYNIHPLTPPEGMAKFLSKVDVHFLIALRNNANSFREYLPSSIAVISVNPYYHRNAIKSLFIQKMGGKEKCLPYETLKEKEAKAANVLPQDDCVLLNTGGTNGEPKIVRLSNRAINYTASKGYDLIQQDIRTIKMLTAIPLFHAFGLCMGVHTPLSHGAATTLMLKFNTKEAIKHIRKGRATTIIGVPALYSALLSKSSFYGHWLKKQIVAWVGGDTCPETLLQKWNQTMEKYGSTARLFEGYGMTETTITHVNCAFYHKKGSIGLAFPDIQDAILNLNTGKLAAPMEGGEILIGGPSLMNGYYNDPELNERSFVDLNGIRYFRTGDYGYKDKDGFLYLKNRLKRIVKIGGETHCPSDVEQTVKEGCPFVKEAFCYGVPHHKKGHIFRLAVVLEKSFKNSTLARELINEEISRKLAPSFLPERILIVNRLPRTIIGKVDPKAFQREIDSEMD